MASTEISENTISSALVRLPSKFSLALYRFNLEAVDTLHLPPLKSSALRGGFGHTFKRLVCSQPSACQKMCRRGNECAYGYVFETTPPDDSQVLRNLTDVPRPFVIRGQQDQRLQIPAGEQFSFDLVLIGHGISFLPYFIAIFQELGRRGLGRSEGNYHLLTVEAVSPYSGAITPVYDSEQMVMQGAGTLLDSQSVTSAAGALIKEFQAQSPATVTLNFITPTRLKHQRRWVSERPPFAVVINKLLSRVSSLSYFHCGQQYEADFRGLIDRAARVEIVRSETRWEDWARFSGRQKQRIEMGGLVGRVTYQGHLAEYLPLLLLGAQTHVGKGAVFGNGQYELEINS